MLDFCKDIREVAEPGALLLNYANPMAMNTWACHRLRRGRDDRPLPRRAERLAPDRARRSAIAPHTELDIFCSGINHQTWYIGSTHKGRDIERDELIAAFERHPVYSQQEKVRIDVLKRFGYYSTEVERPSLANTCPGTASARTRSRAGSTCRDWIHGETGGYLRYSHRGPQLVRDRLPEVPRRGGQAAQRTTSAPTSTPSHIIEALETGRTYRGHFNVRNKGVITNLPDDCIIESPGFVDRFGINMVAGVDAARGLRRDLHGLDQRAAHGVEAAMTGDVELLKLAVLHDPLVGAICTPDEVWQMVDEMLVAQAQWLPQYADAIPAAEQPPAPPEGQDP